jgi:hypothetical protein
MLRKRNCLAVLALCAASIASGIKAVAADSEPFVRPDAAAPAIKTACNYTYPSKVPPRCWLGQKILMLPVAKPHRQIGYMDIVKGVDGPSNPTYAELAGKIATVTKVDIDNGLAPLGKETHSGKITFVVDDTGATYSERIIFLTDYIDDGLVRHIALLRDMQEARRQYLGKQYWLLTGTLPPLVPGPDNDSVHFHKFDKVVISDVLASDADTAELSPVRFVVKNDQGVEAYFDDAVSDTNRGGLAVRSDPDGVLFPNVFSETDVRAAHHWSKQVWDALEADKVYMGMTADQARLGWGAPQSKTRTAEWKFVREHWNYGKEHYLDFENGVLTAIKK